jgi:hypothetical protein
MARVSAGKVIRIVPLVLAQLGARGDVELEVPKATSPAGMEIQSGDIAGKR